MNTQTIDSTLKNDWNLRGKIGLLAGPILFFIILAIPINMPELAHRCLASVLWIAIWWITEAIPLAITSLLPLLLIPLLGIGSTQSAATPYANNNIMLFLGGFIIAQSIVTWNLHQRLALMIVNLIGTSPKMILLGFLFSSGLLSMWISNTAAAVALMPAGISVANLVEAEIVKYKLSISTEKGKFNFGIALMLSIAFGASIGGLGTPIGTPPNLIFIGALHKAYPDFHISFLKWMIFGIPLTIMLLLAAWLVLISVFKPGFKEIPGGKKMIRDELQKLGKWSRGEKAVLVIFLITAFLWITRSFIINPYISEAIDDSTIAILGAISLFILPLSWQKGRFAMDWESAVKIPWDVLLLFGGGLSLAAAITSSGLAEWMGVQMSVIKYLPYWAIILTVVLLVSILSEVTSNTATAAMMMPIMAALASATGTSPISTMLAAAIAASFVFLLPVGTPPNAIIFSSGYLRVVDMVRGGAWVKIASLVLGTLLIIYLAMPVFISK